MNKWKVVAQSLLCAVAVFIATNSIGTMCMGRYYQPKVPKEMLKFKNLQVDNDEYARLFIKGYTP